jgi:membrane fusion protein (multidrug efflux system)
LIVSPDQKDTMTSIRDVFTLLGLSLLAVGSVSSLSGCSKHEEGKKDVSPVPVRVAAAEKRTLRPSFLVIGTVVAQPERLATLTSPVPGLVTRLAVPEGIAVKPGDLIVQLDERKAQYDLDRAKAAYDRLMARSFEEEIKLARSAVEKARSSHMLAQAKLKSATELRTQNPSLVPEIQLKETQSSEQTARAELDAAEAQLKLLTKEGRQAQERELEADWKNAELQLKWCSVTTPLAGDVAEIKARAGQRVDPGTPIATVIDITEVLVQARIPTQRLAMLLEAKEKAGPRGAPARVRSAAFPGETFSAALFRLGQQTEGQTGDVPVWVRVSNPRRLLRVGMPVHLELFGAEVHDLAIPEIALTVNEDGNKVVTLVREGKAFPAEVELVGDGKAEIRAEGWVRVCKGLQAGDQVAVENGYALPEGCPVTALPPRENVATKKAP